MINQFQKLNRKHEKLFKETKLAKKLNPRFGDNKA